MILSHKTEQPLFLWTSFVDPHHPFDPPKAYADMYADTDIPSPASEADDVHLRPPHLLRQSQEDIGLVAVRSILLMKRI